LPVGAVQTALLEDAIAPAAVIPFFNLPPHHPDWRQWQQHYLAHPDEYPTDGYCPVQSPPEKVVAIGTPTFTGTFQRQATQDYALILADSTPRMLVTLDAEIDRQLQDCLDGQPIKVWGRFNSSGNWVLVEDVEIPSSDTLKK
jgi:hypothetical protein